MTRILIWLGAVQAKRPLWVLAVAAVLSVGAFPLVKQLGLNSDWTALLPTHKPSVQDLEKARERVGGLSTLSIALLSKDREALIRFAKDLVPRLQAAAIADVRTIDWNVATYEDFVERNKHWYADYEDLVRLRDALQERVDYEKMRRNPFFVDLGGEEPPDPRTVLSDLRAKADDKRKDLQRFPGGFYLHADGDLLGIFLRTDVRGGDVAAGDRLMERVRSIAEGLDPRSYAPDLKLTFAGDLLSAREEHDAIAKELIIATVLTLVLSLVAIFLLFQRARSVAILGAALITPVLVTFAIAEVTVDYLNTSTAFLGSIVIGNGINPGIVWLARYFEERRKGAAPADAVRLTHLGVWAGTLSASLAAAVAYGSLMISEFRGFRDFGIISGVGMVLCWLGMMGIMPVLALLADRLRPMKFAAEARQSTVYTRALMRAVVAHPRKIAATFSVIALASAGLTAWAVAKNPLEYDFRKLRSERESTVEGVRAINSRLGQIVGKAATGNMIAVLAPSTETASWLKERFETMRDTEGAAFGKIRAITDLLPKEQEQKLPVLEELRALVADVREFADADVLRQLDEHTIPADLSPLTMADIPEETARMFTEKDGTRGRMVFVESDPNMSSWDGRTLVAWAGAIRSVTMPDGSKPILAGRAPVFADMIDVVVEDGPRAVGASFALTALLLMFTFKRAADRLLTLVALLVGILWMGGTMALLDMKLNFLNFVAFPITFGNGVDYAVNVMRRYVDERELTGEGEGAVMAAVGETGGAVIVCSLTTVFGYISLFVSDNQALNSFGGAMGISEVTCLLSAVLLLPAILLLRIRRAERPAS